MFCVEGDATFLWTSMTWICHGVLEFVIKEVLCSIGAFIKQGELPFSRMLNDTLASIDQTLHLLMTLLITKFDFFYATLLCRLRSIAAHRDHFVRCLSVRLSGSHTFLVVTHSYVSQATHAFLGMLPLCSFTSRHSLDFPLMYTDWTIQNRHAFLSSSCYIFRWRYALSKYWHNLPFWSRISL